MKREACRTFPYVTGGEYFRFLLRLISLEYHYISICKYSIYLYTLSVTKKTFLKLILLKKYSFFLWWHIHIQKDNHSIYWDTYKYNLFTYLELIKMYLRDKAFENSDWGWVFIRIWEYFIASFIKGFLKEAHLLLRFYFIYCKRYILTGILWNSYIRL